MVTNSIPGLESGGIVVSLSGETGKRGSRALVSQYVFDVNANWRQILSSNPLRRWLVVRFHSSVGTSCLVNLSPFSNAGNISGIQLRLDDVFQLDDHTPWTGPVFAYLNAAGVSGEYLDIIEVEVQQQ